MSSKITGNRSSVEFWAAFCGCLVVAAAGCVQRRMTIRSNPPGALVYVDDYQIGTTPVSNDFVYYGTRKIRLVKDGYETLTVRQPFPIPWYEVFPRRAGGRPCHDRRCLDAAGVGGGPRGTGPARRRQSARPAPAANGTAAGRSPADSGSAAANAAAIRRRANTPTAVANAGAAAAAAKCAFAGHPRALSCGGVSTSLQRRLLGFLVHFVFQSVQRCRSGRDRNLRSLWRTAAQFTTLRSGWPWSARRQASEPFTRMSSRPSSE